jgi:hypothetical protein
MFFTTLGPELDPVEGAELDPAEDTELDPVEDTELDPPEDIVVGPVVEDPGVDLAKDDAGLPVVLMTVYSVEVFDAGHWPPPKGIITAKITGNLKNQS